jgi:molybdate transport system ATP-binding protein
MGTGMTTPTLDAHVLVERPTLRVDVALTVDPGSVVALLGPNGAGKSTLLRAVAGLVPLAAGHVRLDGRPLDDPARRLRVPTQDRPIGMVFQDYLLFPHLSARDNVAFGLRARGVARTAATVRADALLRSVGLADLATARPSELSGGQAQRVALARALAVQPRLLLLDEPLAALDAGTRAAVRGDLRRHLAAFDGASVLVTHDPLDAMVLADRLVIVEDGRVVQSGTPAEVARRPRTDYVAGLVGFNLLAGTAVGTADGTTIALADGGSVTAPHSTAGPVFVAIRPSSVAVYEHRPHGSPRNEWPATVTGVEDRGDTVRVALRGPPDVLADLTPAAVAELRVEPGRTVWCAVKATELDVYPA